MFYTLKQELGSLTNRKVIMDRKFIQMMSLSAFALMGLASENGVNAKLSLPTTPPPTAKEIKKAYKNCLNHDCTGFQQWSIKAYEKCSGGGKKACEAARDLLAEIKTPRVVQPIYDPEVPHSFKGDNEHTFEEDDEYFSRDFLDE